jgi:hypothetical protein
MLNLEPATQVLAELVRGVRDEQLSSPTPCSDSNLGDLLDHPVRGIGADQRLGGENGLPVRQSISAERERPCRCRHLSSPWAVAAATITAFTELANLLIS